MQKYAFKFYKIFIKLQNKLYKYALAFINMFDTALNNNLWTLSKTMTIEMSFFFYYSYIVVLCDSISIKAMECYLCLRTHEIFLKMYKLWENHKFNT